MYDNKRIAGTEYDTQRLLKYYDPTGPTEGYYPGTKNSIAMLQDDETGWVMKPIVAIDLPFSAVLDTLLAPVDYATGGKDNSESSPAERVKRLEAAETAHNALAPLPQE